MNVSGCMFCKHAEGNTINQKMKNYVFNVALWKRGKNSKCKKNRKLNPPKYSSLYT
jgi:23S rRNA maturation mini-RNase III